MSSYSSDGEQCNTPTHTTVSIPEIRDIPPPSYANSTSQRTSAKIGPWKGSTYIIRDLETELVIGLRDGNLRMFSQEKSSGGFDFGQRDTHWQCHENGQMWFGFKNAVSGRWIGHDANGKHWRFRCEAQRHDSWEYFVTRQHPNGGHLLLVKNRDSFLPMRAADNGELVAERDVDAGTAWEFIKVDM